MGPLEKMKDQYTQRDSAARAWKKQGGKVVGYLSDDAPDEMILAAGLFPFRMSGNPAEGTEEVDKYSESFYDPSVRSILNMLLTGKYDFLDFIIIPHHSDAVLKLYHQLWWIHQVNPAVNFPPVHVFDILHTPFLTTALYVRESLLNLKSKLQEWSGRKIDIKALSRAIAVGNENKALLKKVAELRVAEQPRVSGVEALQMIGSAGFMLKEEHNKLLKEFLDGASTLPEKDGVRIFMEGSDLDNPEIYKLVESSGAVIVAEDSNWGNRYFEDPVDETADPMEALADRYHARSSRPRTQSSAQKVAYTVRRALEAKAQGAIFYLLEWDPAPAWDEPDQIKALKAEGIASLSFGPQKYLLSDSDQKNIKAGIQGFIETLREGRKEGLK
ncbi:MAG TPA: 2-hydroxyacyl-CoA dehydratase family protein [Syntrophorhabdaceae bacterium]|nr:2-hydroxyacyl-CoA dehydratase family protein [Syntrophorhabdaceae bacterium]